MFVGYAVAKLVEALRYKPEGRGFNCRCHWIFHWLNPSGRVVGLWSVEHQVDNLATVVCRLSRNPGSLSRPVMG